MMLDREEAYEEAARIYPDHQVEMDYAGDIKVKVPVGAEGGGHEAEAMVQVGIWNKQTQLSKLFSSQTVFRLPSGAKLMPDVAWMPVAEWRRADEQTRKSYRGVLVPAFVIEVRSQSDNLPKVESKCREWMEGGVQEAWLIDPLAREMQVFRQNGAVDKVSGTLVDGPPFMPGFVLNLRSIWDD